jgi:parvulin-like peptidyl-prolyl isomerase
MLRRSQQGSGTFRTPQQREALLEEMVRNAALASAAASSGYEKDPEILAALDRILADRYMRDQMAKSLKPPTDAEVETFYKDHGADYGAGERRRGSFIQIRVGPAASAETKRAMENKAKQAAAEARGPETNAFAMAAARHSDDTPTRYVGGDMGWVQKTEGTYRWDKAVTAALFEISAPGEVAGPIPAPDGFYVLRLVEKTDGKPRPLDVVRPYVEQRMMTERRAQVQREAYDRARRVVPVTIDKTVLDAIEPPPLIPAAGEEPPPPLPGMTPAPTKPKPSPEVVR